MRPGGHLPPGRFFHHAHSALPQRALCPICASASSWCRTVNASLQMTVLVEERRVFLPLLLRH